MVCYANAALLTRPTTITDSDRRSLSEKCLQGGSREVQGMSQRATTMDDEKRCSVA
jgi:hypothetical protein